VLVTVTPDHEVLDRRRVELVDASLPALPHHHECQSLPIERALELIDKVQASAAELAANGLSKLAASVPADIAGVALRVCPPLPETVAERITNYRAQTMADGIMYRQVLARAAEARGWQVHWYERSAVLGAATKTVGSNTVGALLKRTGALLGPPWREDHRLAMAAAIAALSVSCSSSAAKR
jgi:hypothetical protein